MNSILSVQNITRFYGQHTALNDVSFELKRKNITGLLGLNGAGKSTLLSIMAGTLLADDGRMVISDDDKTSAPQKTPQIGYLPEGAPLFEDLTVTEHLRVMGGLQSLSGPALKTAISNVLAAFELEAVSRKLIDALSKGYKRRVALAAAFLATPQILLLDEPTDGLDPIQKARMIQYLKSTTRNQTLLVSTHSLSEVEALCDRVVLLHHGKLIFNDTVEALRATVPDQNIETAFERLVHADVVLT